MDSLLRSLNKAILEEQQALSENHAPDYPSYMERVGRIRGKQEAAQALAAALREDNEDDK